MSLSHLGAASNKQTSSLKVISKKKTRLMIGMPTLFGSWVDGKRRNELKGRSKKDEENPLLEKCNRRVGLGVKFSSVLKKLRLSSIFEKI